MYFSGTVNPLNTIEPSIEDAYSNMLNKLWTPDFALIIPQDDQSVCSLNFIINNVRRMLGLKAVTIGYTMVLTITSKKEENMNIYKIWPLCLNSFT